MIKIKIQQQLGAQVLEKVMKGAILSSAKPAKPLTSLAIQEVNDDEGSESGNGSSPSPSPSPTPDDLQQPLLMNNSTTNAIVKRTKSGTSAATTAGSGLVGVATVSGGGRSK